GAAPGGAEALDPENVVARRIVLIAVLALGGAGGGDADDRDIAGVARDRVDRRRVGGAVEDQLGAVLGDLLAEEFRAAQARPVMTGFKIGRVVDHHDAEISGIAHELQDTTEALRLAEVDPAGGEERRRWHRAGARDDGDIADAANERKLLLANG